MTLSAVQRGWGDPRAAGYRSAHIVTCNAGGIKVSVHEDVLDVFRYLNTRMARAYNLAGYADDWGYALRCIRGTGPGTSRPCVLSNHSWGLAEDLNATVNPMTSDLKANHQFVRAIVDPILAPFQGRLLWGGEYVSARKDYMHFEYVGRRDQAAGDSATARRLLTPPRPAPPEEDDMDKLITVDGRKIYVANGRHGARHVEDPTELEAMKIADLVADVPVKKVTQAHLNALLRAATR